jgi:putative copper resistance protein D
VSDWPLVAIRLVLYADLGLLFGIPLFGLYGLTGKARRDEMPVAIPCAALAAGGLLLGALGFAMVAASMSGTTVAGLDPAIVRMLLTETSLGWAFLARSAALALAFLISLRGRPGSVPGLVLLASSGAIADSSLAWSGHGAASESAAGLIHLGGDIVHLLAASAWIGALAVLLLLVTARRTCSIERINTAHAALAGFSVAGSVIVGLVVASGLINGAFLVGAGNVTTLSHSLYGRLLIAKLLLFGGMLGCAALNRYRLTPRLADAIGRRAPGEAIKALRHSIAFETTLAIAVLGLVSWLGTLEPPAVGS